MWSKLTFKDVLAIVVSTLLLLIVCLIVFVKIPAENKEVAGQISGGLIPTLMLILGYYFGSSSGSTKKDETISDMVGSVVKKDEVINAMTEDK